MNRRDFIIGAVGTQGYDMSEASANLVRWFRIHNTAQLVPSRRGTVCAGDFIEIWDNGLHMVTAVAENGLDLDLIAACGLTNHRHTVSSKCDVDL